MSQLRQSRSLQGRLLGARRRQGGGKGPRGKGKEKEKEKEKDTAASACSKDTADAAWMALSALTDSDSEFEELTYSSDSDAISFKDFWIPSNSFWTPPLLPRTPRTPGQICQTSTPSKNSDDEDEDELEAHTNEDSDSDSDSDDDELPDLQPLSDYDSDSDDDEYGDMPGLMDAEESNAEGDEGTGGGCDESEESDDCEDMYMEDSLPYDTEAYTSTFSAAALSKGWHWKTPSSTPISSIPAPLATCLAASIGSLNYVELDKEQPITAADKRTFKAVGRG